MDLSIEQCDESDHGTQRCRIGPRYMEESGISVGSCVFISTHDRSYICSAWPRYDGLENIVKCDRLTHMPNTESLVNRELCTVKSVRIRKITRFSVTVVFTSVKDVKQYKQCLKVESHPVTLGSLKKNVLDILRKFYLADGMSMNCASFRMAKLYGISHLSISQVCTGDQDITCGTVSSNTKIEVLDVMSDKKFGMNCNSNKVECGGCDLQIQLLTEFLRLPSLHAIAGRNLGIAYPHGILIQGPSGTGKSTLVMKVACDLDLIVLKTDGSKVIGSHPGEGEEKLRALFVQASELSEEAPCVVLIEEVDAMCPRRSAGTSSSQECRMVAQLGIAMDRLTNRQKVLVVGTTSHPQMVDSTLRRPGRFEKEILLGVPTVVQRRQMVELLLASKHGGLQVDASQVADMTPGFVAADLKALVNHTHYLAATDSTGTEDGIKMDHFERALHDIVPSTQRGSDVLVDHRPVSWDEIGGLHEVKVKLQQAVEWPMQHGAAFSRLGIKPPSGVLLYGPPGCAKTLLVRAAASSCGATFLAISGAQIHSPFVGDAEKKLTEVFRQARAGAPSIIFLDEVDAIMGKRKAGSKGGGVHERVLSMLLNEMDGVGVRIQDLVRSEAPTLQAEGCQPQQEDDAKLGVVPVDNSSVLVVAATNRPDMVDDALMRPGRLDKVLYVPPPDTKARFEILCVHTKNTPLENVDLKSLAEETERFSGADLENLCREAALHALSVDGLNAQVVTQAHFTTILQVLKPSLTSDQLLQYQQYRNPSTAHTTSD